MRRAAGLIGCVLLAGCDGGSGGGRQLAKPFDNSRPPTTAPSDDMPAKPAASDPEAAKIVERAIAEHAGGSRAALAAFKTHSLRRAGQMFDVPTGRLVKAEMTVDAVWPDRFRGEFRMETRGPKPLLVSLGAAGWWSVNQAEPGATAQPLDATMSAVMAADQYAEWLILAVPLAEATDAVYALVAGEEKVNGKPTKGVRAWLPGRPLVRIQFDAATDRVVQVRYLVQQYGGMVPKSMVVSDYKRVGGILHPDKIDYAENNRVYAQWPATQYEPGKKVAPAIFDKP